MLEKIEVSVLLQHRVMDWMKTVYRRMSKPGSGDKINFDCQPLLFFVEIDPLDIPRVDDVESFFK